METLKKPRGCQMELLEALRFDVGKLWQQMDGKMISIEFISGHVHPCPSLLS